MFIIIVFYLVAIGRRDIFLSCPLSFHTYASLTSSVSLSYFIGVLPRREYFGKHSFMSSPFSIALLNGTSSFLSLVQENINMPRGHYYRLCS